MDPEREDRNDFPPSIVSSWWFRGLLALAVLALIVAIALPHLLDWLSPVVTRPSVVQKPQPAPSLRPSPGEAPPAPAPLPPTPRQIEKPPSQLAETPLSPKPAREAAKQPAPKRSVKASKEEDGAPPSSTRGGYMVQVGVFQDEANAARLAARLAKEKYPFQRVTESRSGGEGREGGHEVVVAGASVDEVNGKLRGTSQKAVATSEGVVIQPALPLKDAVALSQELRADGLTVKIRRAQGTATLHVVRVGAYPTRSRAEAVRQELEEKGYSGFIVPEVRR